MVGIAVALATAFGWAWVAARLGGRLGYLDVPDDPLLKVHRAPAVPLGGVGIFLGVHLGMAASGHLHVGLLAASGLLLVLGLVDDRRHLSPWLRLVVEGAAGLLLFLGWGGGLGRALLVAGLVVVAVNAVNLFDGLDGLAASAALVTALGSAWLAEGRGMEGSFGLILAAAVGGFLVMNWHPARVFLGDNGSYVLGVFLVHAFLVASPDLGGRLVVASGLLGVFLLDLGVTLLRRRLHRRPLFLGDRSHLYDQLRDRGLGVRRIAVVAAALQLVLVALVVVAEAFFGWLGSLVVLVLVGLGLVGMAWRGGFLAGTA